MKRWGQILSCVCAFSLASAGIGHSQAVKDPKLVGSYIGYISEHFFVAVPDIGDLFVSGALFNFNMQFQQLGYHEGVFRSGVMFMNGKKFQISGSAIVPPFPTTKNRQASLYMECRTINSIDDDLIKWRLSVWNAPYSKTPSAWFGEPAEYHSTVLAVDMNVEYNDTTGTHDWPASANAIFEAQKLSNLTAGMVKRRVKINR